MTTLVTGATGSIGRHLTAALTQAGEPVRALTRRPDTADLPAAVDVVGGDLTDPSTLTPALFDGVDRIFVFPAPTGVDDLVAQAVDAGVDRFVVLSSLAAAAEFPRDLGSASHTHHLAIEQAVTSRTDDWTILRPGTFSSNLLSWAWPIKTGAPIRAPYIHSSQAPIHEADVADAAASALLREDLSGTTHALSGPQSLTRIEQVQAIAAALGRDLALVEVTPEEFRADVSQFVPEPIITMLLDYWSDTVTEPDQVRTGMIDLTGRQGRTLQQWALDHRADFTG